MWLYVAVCGRGYACAWVPTVGLLALSDGPLAARLRLCFSVFDADSNLVMDKVRCAPVGSARSGVPLMVGTEPRRMKC